ncbi:MAG TPA: homoserine dehydrogenase [Candidatus Acidoferrales bacterium]|nr:homoserine dehydrogenase [Candidatus Acidoferrales bacterium]
MAIAPDVLLSEQPLSPLRRKTIVVGLLGCGVVGGGVAARLLGEGRINTSPASLARVLVRDLHKARFPESVTPLLTTRAEDIIDDPEVQIVVETIGGTGIAVELVERALRRGKHVVSANKALVAHAGPRLAALARDHHAAFRYEASVGGAIPIVRALADCLAAEDVVELSGVMNGTSNYIMGAMAQGKSFDEALHEAQVAGYAEPDPTNDVEGIDAAQKLCVLSAIGYRRTVRLDRVVRQSLRALSPADFVFAKREGYALVPLTYGRRSEEEVIEAVVSPAYVPADHEFARPKGPGNVVRVVGVHSGPLHFSGTGAGRSATASAVFSDLVEIARRLERWEHQKTEVHDALPLRVQAPKLGLLLRVEPGAAQRVATVLRGRDLVADVLGDDGVKVAHCSLDHCRALLHDAHLGAAVHSLYPLLEE